LLFPRRGEEAKEGKTGSCPLFFVRLAFLSLSLSLSLFSDAERSEIVERPIYGYKITHVKFEAGRVCLEDLCASLAEKARRRREKTSKFFTKVRCKPCFAFDRSASFAKSHGDHARNAGQRLRNVPQLCRTKSKQSNAKDPQGTADNASDKILNEESARSLETRRFHERVYSPIKSGKKSHCGRNRMHARPNMRSSHGRLHFRFGHSALNGHPLFCGRLTICDNVVAPISAPDGHRLISRNKRREKPSWKRQRP